MLEINDQLRLVRHEGREGGFWSVQKRCDGPHGSYKRPLWKPVGSLLTAEQAERWLKGAQVPGSLMEEFPPSAR